MESKKVKDILNQFDGNNTYKKIFINGSWGIGKSFYTNEYKSEHEGRIVYVSLFGKTSFEAIVDSLSKELLKKLDKKNKLIKNAKNLGKKIQGSFSYKGFSISSPTIKNKTLLEEYSTLLDKKELIIIFDDLERKSINIPIEDIMGLIEEFSTLENVKIVIIGDETNIDEEEKKKWDKFKEKIIDKEYKIDSFSSEAIQSLVINKLNTFICEEKLKEFISTFLSKHNVKNLRTINKGINLFFEIVNNYVYKKYDENIYLTILKNCMSVVIEYTEELYKPNEDDKNSSDTSNSWKYSLDSDMTTRIISHYFSSLFMNNKDCSILEYIINFYNSNINDNEIQNFNSVLENYLNVEEEKNIFYLSEDKIKESINKIYTDITSETYQLTNTEKFIDDLYNLLVYSKALALNYKIEDISKHSINILFNQFYDITKEEYQNKIDTFSILKDDRKELIEILNKYNDEVSNKYTKEKIDNIVSKFKEKDLNKKYLEFLDWKFIQPDSKYAKEYFSKCCKENNYLLPPLDGELEDFEWSWTHGVWKLFYENLDDTSKNNLNKYAEKLKMKNKLSEYRINALQSYRPLIEKNKEISND